VSFDPRVESQRRASLLAMRVADMCRRLDADLAGPNPYHVLSQLPPDIVVATSELEALVGKLHEKQSVVLAGTRVFSRIDRDNWREWPAEEETHDD
jgi:hypothetical protein